MDKEKQVGVDREYHKKDVLVGKDTFDNIEYFVSAPFEKPHYSYEVTFKYKLEDFWYEITSPFYKLKHKVVRIYWEVRYGFQRMFRGYDSVDVFETYWRFTDRYRKILADYKKNHYGCPYGLEENEWEEIIDKMLYHLTYMDEDNVMKELNRDVPDNWCPKLTDVNRIMEHHKNEFFKLFSEYFYNLWD